MWSVNASALVFKLPANGDNVVGEVRTTIAESGDNFSKIGRRFGVGYYQLVEANPGINPNRTPEGTEIVIPAKFILPSAPRTGIVINLAELRLYYYPPGGQSVLTYPLGIGRDAGWDTPLGTTKITTKETNPTWVPTKNIREFRRKEGVELPERVPPGIDNPLGGYRMRLSLNAEGTYLIHGTNDSSGVGRRSSSGCIRLFPEDVETLFSHVSVGTQVNIIHEPNKVGLLEGKIYLESHEPLQELRAKTPSLTQTIAKVAKNPEEQVDLEEAKEIVQSKEGIPQEIGEV